MRIPLLLFFLSLSYFSAKSQSDTIKLLNGKILVSESIKEEGDWVRYALSGKRKGSFGRISREDIFSVKSANGNEEVWYQKYDESDPDELNQEEMREFITGMQIARVTYKPAKDWIIGAGTGFAAGFITNSVLFGIAVPPIITLGAAITPVYLDKIKPKNLDDDDLIVLGIKKQRQSLRTINTLTSAAIGVACGIITSRLVYK